MIRLGIICPSEIAYRRFAPALLQNKAFQFVGIGIADAKEWYGKDFTYDETANQVRIKNEIEKAHSFLEFFNGGAIYESYEDLVTSKDIDAVYLPLPPALHYDWAKLALDHDKHVFVEKPSTIDFKYTEELITIARAKKKAFHENYMFVYHDQLKAINSVVANGDLGSVRLYRISFGFPRRSQNDFRYNKALGGGALIDAGGYTLKYATYLLGETAKLTTAQLNYLPEYDVDMYGSATMVNDKGVTAQLAFGMDNDYKCELEIWGSEGTLISNRILTAPAGFIPEYTIKRNQEFEIKKLPADDAFRKSIERFEQCINCDFVREEEYILIQKEADLMTQFREMSK